MTDTINLMILGSCGFTLGNFVRNIMHKAREDRTQYPYNVVSIDRVGGNPNMIYYNADHKFHIADIRDKHVIDTIFQFERPDIVIHGASEKPNGSDQSFLSTNILGTQNVIDACLKHKVGKLIYLSDDKVYGYLSSESDAPWTEQSPINPVSSYAASKASAELLVMAAHKSHGLAYSIVRSSNLYGPRQSPDKLITNTMRRILNDQKIPVHGNGLNMRDWLHVFDHNAALRRIILDSEPNAIYNVGAGQEYTNFEVVQHVCNVMGKGWQLIEHTNDQRKDFRYAMDCSKIKALGWKQKTANLKAGLDTTWEWVHNNLYSLR